MTSKCHPDWYIIPISCLMWNIYLYFIILKLFTNFQNIIFLVKIVGVNNSININKTNNHLSPLESLTHHLSSWLTTWAFDSPLESLTHHLSSWLTTWVFDSPFEFLTHHLNPWLTTWVFDSPLESLTHHSSSWLWI